MLHDIETVTMAYLPVISLLLGAGVVTAIYECFFMTKDQNQ